MFTVTDPTKAEDLQTRATFPNPERRAVERRLAKFKEGSRQWIQLRYRLNATPESLCLWSTQDGRTLVHRGLRAEAGAPVPPMDGTCTGGARGLPDLREYQRTAVERMEAMPEGILWAPTGSGKTCMAKHLVNRVGLPALIVVPTLALLEQWIRELGRHWDPAVIGKIGGGSRETALITVASIATLARMVAEGWRATPGGILILDECHHALASTWRRVLAAHEDSAACVWGLSATPWRNSLPREALACLIGPIVEVPREEVLDAGGICPFEVVRVDTGFQGTVDPVMEYSAAVKELVEDAGRNLRIQDLSQWISGLCMVLTERVAHVEELRARCPSAGSLVGGMRDSVRAEELARAQASGLLIATTGILSEGFDLPEASALILATPGRFDGALIQRVGRCLRPAPGKLHATIYDLVDSDPLFLSQWRSRSKTYRSVGASIRTLKG